MKILKRVAIAVWVLGLLNPTPALGQAWETDDYGFLKEDASINRTRRRPVRNRRSQYIPYYSAVTNARPANTVSAANTTNSFRTFSYAPQIATGDSVTVVGMQTQLMQGRDVLGHITVGTELTVLEIRGPWVGVRANFGGERRSGWIWYGNLETANSGDEASGSPANTQQYRSFSYEPSTIAAGPTELSIITGRARSVRSFGVARTTTARKPTYLRPGAKARGEFGRGGR